MKNNPIYLIVVTVLFIVATHFFSVNKLMQQRVTGLSLTYDHKSSTLVINNVTAPNDQIKELVTGMPLISLSNETESLNLTKNITKWAQESKDNRQLENYFSEHRELYKILKSKNLTANKGTKDEFRLITEEIKNVDYFKFDYWVVRVSNILALLICLFVWIYKPNTKESNTLMVCGTTYYLFGLFYSITVGMELTLAEETLRLCLYGQVTFLSLFSLSFFYLLTRYPKKTINNKFDIFLFLAVILGALSNLQLLPQIPIHSYFLPILSLLLISNIIAYYQWSNTKDNPIYKITTIALHSSLLLPTHLIILLYFIPVMVNENQIIGHLTSHIILLFIFIGFAASVLKFKLFEIERWWFNSWIWILSTLLLISTDLVLIYILDWSKELTTSLTVVLIGFIYFPLRQIIFVKALKIKEPLLNEGIIYYNDITKKSSSIEEYDKSWLETLEKTFKPFNKQLVSKVIEQEEITENGLYLYVKSLNSKSCYQLSGKQYGNRLFNSRDLKYCKILFNTVQSITQSNIAKQEIRLSERKRIMNDLHDNLGATLLTMTHNLDSKEDRDQAKNALKLLRDTVYFSTTDDDIYCLDLVNRCRSELEDRLVSKQTKPNWKSSFPEELTLSPAISLAISYILREAFTNAIKHANPDYIKITITYTNNTLELLIANNHTPSTWQPGIGMNSIKRRCKSINSECYWLQKNNEFQLIVLVNL